MKTFFYRNWGLYYLFFFLLLGLLIYALLWNPNVNRYQSKISELNQQLDECRVSKALIDTTSVIPNSGMPKMNKVGCDASVKSGGQGVTTTQHELGERSGVVIIQYDMQTVPDEITVNYNGKVVAKSNGLVQGIDNLQFTYNAVSGNPTFCTVTISAPKQQTQWEYLLNCPQN